MGIFYSEWSGGLVPSGASVKYYWRSYLDYTYEETQESVIITAGSGIGVKPSSVSSSTTWDNTLSILDGDEPVVEPSVASLKGTQYKSGARDIQIQEGVEFVIPKTGVEQTLTVSSSTHYNKNNAWGVTLVASDTITVPALAQATVNFFGERMTGDSNTASIVMSISSTEGLTFSEPVVEINETSQSLTWYKDGEPQEFPRPSIDGTEIFVAEVSNIYPMKTYDFVCSLSDSQSRTTTRTFTLANIIPNYWNTTITVNADSYQDPTDFAFPELTPAGKAVIDVYAYNTVLEQYDKITNANGWIITTGDNWWSVNVPLTEDYVLDNTEVSTTADVKIEFDTTSTTAIKSHTAIFSTTRNINFANGLANCVFVSGCTEADFSSRVWYSALNNPLYFPDTSYTEVGSNDKKVMGLTKVGSYLGVVKQGATTDSSIYLLYPTSFEDDTTYAQKQTIAGAGAYGKYTFNVVNNETLFLSSEGICAISTMEDEEHKLQDRSFFINGKLTQEDLAEGFSIVYDGKYFLAFPNGHCYVLDANQKNSYGTDKTNLVYECYYLENIPARNFVKAGDDLLFSDFNGNLCIFKNENYEDEFTDEYSADSIDTDIPVVAEWSTLFDDDGSLNYYKTMQKKGCVVSLLPENISATGTRVFVRKDTNEPVEITREFSTNEGIPNELFINKKFKKYKRLQIIARNENAEPFGVNSIVKQYTVGNYAKK